MPRKFRRVLRKRYSRSKSAKAEQSDHHDDSNCSGEEDSIGLITTDSISEASTQTDLCVRHTREVSTETDPMKLNSTEASTQTDSWEFSVATCTVSTQTEDTVVTFHPTLQTSHQSGKCVVAKYYHNICCCILVKVLMEQM